jgi:broad specificity phosphatase PhoE
VNDNAAVATRFGLMRHGETEWNQEKRIQGHLDSRLTDRGRQRAVQWGERLRPQGWDRLLASDLGRAVATARCINRTLELPLETDPGLREQHWGRWSGRTVADLLDEIPDLAQRYGSAGWAFCPPGGESRAAVCERARQALCAAAERWPGQRVLVVSHAGMIRCLINGLLGRAFLPEEPPLLWSGHLHRLVSRPGRLCVEQLNAVCLDEPREKTSPAQEADFITQ